MVGSIAGAATGAIAAGVATGGSKPPAKYSHSQVERFPTLESPDSVEPEREFSLLVSLTEEQTIPDVQVLQGTPSAQGKVGLALPEADSWTLDVVLSAPGFEIVDGANSARIILPRHGDSTPARFRLKAKRNGAQQRRLYATMWYRGAYLAKFARPIAVVEASVPAQRPAFAPAAPTGGAAFLAQRGEGAGRSGDTPEEPPAQTATISPAPSAVRGPATALELDLKAPVLTVYVQGGSIVIVSNYLSPTTRQYPYSRPTGLANFVAARYASFVAAVPRGVRPIDEATGPSEMKERTVPLLRGFGRELYAQFAPAPFQSALWQLHDQLGEWFTSIQIFTDDPTLPWELMRPTRGADELDFLGVEFRVARWHVGDSGGQLMRPPQDLILKQLVAVAPRYAASAALPGQSDELTALEALPPFQRADGTFGGLKQIFAAPPEGIVHFAGHGVVRGSGSGVAEYAISLEDGDLDLTTWRGLVHVSDAHPLIFFNACDVGQAQRIAGFVDGWAPAVLDTGASGYIGGLWPLGDRGAAEFARTFYDALAADLAQGQDVTVADLLRLARKRFYEDGDPTALAYVYYGDPNLRLRASGPAHQ